MICETYENMNGLGVNGCFNSNLISFSFKDWLDLVNQVMNKFVKTSKKSLIRLSAQSLAAKMLIEKPNKNEFW